MNYIVSDLRKIYKIIFISNKKVFIHSHDINIYHNIPNEILESGNELVTGFSENAFLFAIKNPYLVYLILTDISNLNKLLIDTIREYNPVKIIAHCGNVKDLILLDRLDIPTNIVYFCPGFLPNKSIPFVFNNYLKLPECTIFDSQDSEINNDLTIKYYESIVTLCQFYGKNINLEDCIKKIQKMKHLLFYSKVLVPSIDYSIPLEKKHFSLIPYITSTQKLPEKLINWIHGKSDLIFVSFGSYAKNILEMNDYFISRLRLFCRTENYYAIIQIHKNYHYSECKHLLFYKDYINYRKMVQNRKCKLVIFTGSIGLQSICWEFNRRMLFIPYIPEQFFWAKLYKYHTGVEYIDCREIDEIGRIIPKILQSLQVSLQFYYLLKQTNINIPSSVKKYI